MARTDADQVEDFDFTEQVAPDAGTEPEVQAEAPAEAEASAEPVAETTSGEDAEAAELERKIEETVEAFKEAATTAADSADDEGHLTPDQLSPVVEKYRAVEGGNKGKKIAKDFITDQMKEALTSGPDGFVPAMAWNAIQDAVLTAAPKSSGGGTRTPAAPVSQTRLFADKIASLRLALELAEANVPEGVDEDWEAKITGDLSKAQALLDFEAVERDEEDETPAPGVTPVERAAVKLATGRGPRKAGRPSGAPYQGTRRDVAAHITNAFAAHPSGTFLTIAEIKSTPSEEYGSDSPSAGAISARLFPKAGPDKMSVPGVVAAQEGGKNGARKI